MILGATQAGASLGEVDRKGERDEGLPGEAGRQETHAEADRARQVEELTYRCFFF